jgi:hypothetical protein
LRRPYEVYINVAERNMSDAIPSGESVRASCFRADHENFVPARFDALTGCAQRKITWTSTSELRASQSLICLTRM